MSLQKAEDKALKISMRNYQCTKKASSQKRLIHTALAEKLKQFMDILASWRLYKPTSMNSDLEDNDRFYYDYVGACQSGPARQANLMP